MCYVFDHELKTIGSANLKTSLDIGFFGVSFGALIAFAVTLATVVFTSPFLFAAFWALFGLFLLSSLFFLIRFIVSLERIIKRSK